MIRKFFFTLIVCGAILSAAAQNTKKVMRAAAQQTLQLYEESKALRTERLVFPRTLRNDSLRVVISDDWTSGFFPGMLWFYYEYTNDPAWKSKAQELTSLMYKEPGNRNSHDIGFKVYNSYGNGFRLTGNQEYKQAVLKAAATLATRFNEKAGVIKSWDFPRWKYPVIIDNMMNLELLFAATRIGGDSTYYRIAVSHANTTMKNHYRNDMSTWHVLDYDTLTGAVIERVTHQGYADQSAWARGQAWGLYGYTMCYRETGDIRYLQQAEAIANFLLKHPRLPTDKVPYWDFDDPAQPASPRDASAAAIMASALYELQQFSAQKKYFRKSADDILNSLTKYYRAAPGTNHGFVLVHSVGNKPAGGEIDVPLIYADYYYLEALLRRSKK